MARKRWSDLDVRVRRGIVVGAGFDGILKTAALIDLARRPASQVHGSKLAWAAAITLANSLGAVPIAYFTRGRRRQS